MKEQPEVFSVQFLNVINYRFIRDNRLYLMLVLKGSVRLSVAGNTPLKVNKDQVQVINRNSDWQIEGDQDNITVVVAISPWWLFHSGEVLNHTHFSIGHHPSPGQARRLSQLISRIAILWLKKKRCLATGAQQGVTRHPVHSDPTLQVRASHGTGDRFYLADKQGG